MELLVIGIILIILSCAFSYFVYKKDKKINKINYDIALKNKELEITHNNLNKSVINANNELTKVLTELNEIKQFYDSKEELSQKAFESYCDILDNNYKEKEKEYEKHISLLNSSYEKHQLDLLKNTESIRSELESIKATRTAAIQAQIKEQEIKEQRDFYMLCPKTSDINDIKRLERIKPELNNPRILSMLIWTTFFQKPMTALCNKVLGTTIVTGIYKITNQNNDMCYIGQSVDIATRWKDHAKCGLGIDAPIGNKLYKAMQEEGIWNFSWELLEECSRDKLDEKERFYIDLYQSKDFGYNTTKGVK